MFKDHIDIASEKYEKIINEVLFSKENYGAILIKDLKNDLSSAILYTMIELIATSKQVLYYLTEEDAKKGYRWVADDVRRLDNDSIETTVNDEEVLTVYIEDEKIKIAGITKEIEYKEVDVLYIAEHIYNIKEEDLTTEIDNE